MQIIFLIALLFAQVLISRGQDQRYQATFKIVDLRDLLFRTIYWVYTGKNKNHRCDLAYQNEPGARCEIKITVKVNGECTQSLKDCLSANTTQQKNATLELRNSDIIHQKAQYNNALKEYAWYGPRDPITNFNDFETDLDLSKEGRYVGFELQVVITAADLAENVTTATFQHFLHEHSAGKTYNRVYVTYNDITELKFRISYAIQCKNGAFKGCLCNKRCTPTLNAVCDSNGFLVCKENFYPDELNLEQCSPGITGSELACSKNCQKGEHIEQCFKPCGSTLCKPGYISGANDSTCATQISCQFVMGLNWCANGECINQTELNEKVRPKGFYKCKCDSWHNGPNCYREVAKAEAHTSTKSGSGLSAGAVVGIVIFLIAIVALVGFGYFEIRRRNYDVMGALRNSPIGKVLTVAKPSPEPKTVSINNPNFEEEARTTE